MKKHLSKIYTSIYVSLILVFLMGFSKIAYSSDKELFDKILKNAITTIILEKYPSVETNNGIVFKLNRVFPTPSGTFNVREKGKCKANWKTNFSRNFGSSRKVNEIFY